MNVPGEDLPKVTHYYREPFPYVQQKVAVIGARNSAAKAALDCYRHGAQVTMIVRSPELSDKIKYWIRPDLENRIKEGSIKALFSATVRRSVMDHSWSTTAEGVQEVENDWVLATTGYHPDYGFLEQLGLEFRDDGFGTPVYDEATFETTRPGRLHRRNGLRRLPDEPLVHRERPLPRAADRPAHRPRPGRAGAIREDPLEDGGIV